MMNTITESTLSEQYVQSHDYDHDHDHGVYQQLTDGSKHVSEKSMLLMPVNYTEDEVVNLEEMKRIFKQQHPWSISDPFPQPLQPEFYPREYNSSPNLKPRVEGKCRQFASFSVQNTVVSSIVQNRKYVFKWGIIVLNVFLEVFQAALTQESSKIKREMYLKLSIIVSSICLMMSILEIFHEAKSAGVKCVRNGCCCFMLKGGVFGNFALYFGLISSTIQLIVTIAQKCSTRLHNIIKFDYLPLLLSVCYLLAALIGSRKNTSSGIVRCKFHGYNTVEGVLLDGYDGWVFECPEC